MIQFLKFYEKTGMSTLNLFRTNLAVLQPNLCNGLPKYGTPNLCEKLFSTFLLDGLGSFTASNFFTTTSKKCYGYLLCQNIFRRFLASLFHKITLEQINSALCNSLIIKPVYTS